MASGLSGFSLHRRFFFFSCVFCDFLGGCLSNYLWKTPSRTIFYFQVLGDKTLRSSVSSFDYLLCISLYHYVVIFCIWSLYFVYGKTTNQPNKSKQRVDIFYSVWKVAAAKKKKLFSDVSVIGKTNFNGYFLFHLITARK